MRLKSIVERSMIVIVILLSISMIHADCKLMGLISFNNYELNDIVANPNVPILTFTNNCLNALQIQGGDGTYPNNNPHGWSIVEYEKNSKFIAEFTDQTTDLLLTDGLIWRDAGSATDGSSADHYNHVESRLQNSLQSQGYRDLHPHIILGHVRRATSGATNIPDPHPFIWETSERHYSFIHNGGVKTDDSHPSETNMNDLINSADPTWILNHPILTGVDSEYFFSYVMLKITQNSNNVFEGIKSAIHEMVSSNVVITNSALNFILTDGVDLYVYRKLENQNDIYHPLSYFYSPTISKYTIGVMSVLPNNTPTHYEILDDEFIYISRTGKVAKFQHFSEQNNEMLTYVRDFHAEINWSSFPVMEGDEVPVTPFTDPLLQYGLHEIYYASDEEPSYYDENSQTWNPEIMLNNTQLYKLNLYGSTTPFTTGGFQEQGSLRSSQAPVLENIEPWIEYWVGYQLLPSQNIREAFGTYWEYVSTVKAENWYYERIPENQTKFEEPPVLPAIAWSTYNKSMDFGKGYIVTFRTCFPSFNWENPHHIDLNELCAIPPEKPEYFDWKIKPEYMAIDIMDSDDTVNILEIGAFQGDKCIGGIKPDRLPCQLLVYPDWSDTTSITFEIVWKEVKSITYLDRYMLWDQEVYSFIPGQIGTSSQYYQVKLLSDTDNLPSCIAPVITMQNAPNPIYDDTRIIIKLSSDANIDLTIYNIKGQRISNIFNGIRKAGKHSFIWSGTDENNKKVASGIYFAQISCGNKTVTHKMLVIK